MSYQAKIIIWDNNHLRPATLASVTIEVANPDEARRKANELIRTTPRGHYAFYDVPHHWNQNIRSGWTHGR